jgi:cell division septal protein FtsQ
MQLYRRQARRVTPRIYGNLQQRPPERRFVFRKYLPLIGVILGVLSILFVIFGPWMRIRTVEVRGVVLIDPASVTAAVPLGALTLFWDDADFFAEMNQRYPGARFVVQRGIPSTISIRVEESEAALLWKTAGTIAVVSNTGTVITTAANGSPMTSVLQDIPVVTDTQNLPITPGTTLVSQTFIEAVQNLYRVMPEELPSEQIQSVTVGTTTYEVTVVLASGRSLILTTLGDMAVQLRNARRVFAQTNLAPSATLDLRVDGWAYAR